MKFKTLDEAEDYFMKNDGWNCNKDNIEDRFSAWLENNEHEIEEDMTIPKSELDPVVGDHVIE